VTPLRAPPAHLYSEQNIARFRDNVRELFLSGDNALTRNYLRFLIDRIVVNDTKIDIFGRSEAAVRMMAAGEGGGVLTPEAPVLTAGVDWLPKIVAVPTTLSPKSRKVQRVLSPEALSDSWVSDLRRQRVENGSPIRKSCPLLVNRGPLRTASCPSLAILDPGGR
jgi:hypothetical protein